MSVPLIDARSLAALADEALVRIVDCRFDLADTDAGRRAFMAAHVPGAVYAHLDTDLSAPTGPGRHPLPHPYVFAERLGRLGISNDSMVVVYDDAGGAIASRLWWMLRSLGHEHVRVLDGGWQDWMRFGAPTESGDAVIAAAVYVAPPAWSGTIDREALRGRLGTLTLIDARAAERYRGEIEPLDPVAGHIPTAVNMPFAANLGSNGRFLPPVELAERFAAAGAEQVVYCGSGVTACHDILAMEIAGLPAATLYPGSWSDWSTAGEEVATGAS